MTQTAFTKRDLMNEPAFGPWLSQASILVIDDEPGMRNFLVKILKPRCRNVAEAANTEEAAKLLDAGHFDVVILDNIMPGKNGVDWLREQRQKRDSPLIKKSDECRSTAVTPLLE